MTRILLAEDDFGVRDTLKDFLEFFYEDLEIVQAINGKEAIDLVSASAFDILITDQMMPDMKGSEFIAKTIDKLRADGTWIYVYSGQLMDELSFSLKEYGEVKIIDKFTNPMFFKEIIEEYRKAKNSSAE